jgi:hypothetical protein
LNEKSVSEATEGKAEGQEPRALKNEEYFFLRAPKPVKGARNPSHTERAALDCLITAPATSRAWMSSRQSTDGSTKGLNLLEIRSVLSRRILSAVIHSKKSTYGGTARTLAWLTKPNKYKGILIFLLTFVQKALYFLTNLMSCWNHSVVAASSLIVV